MARSQSEIEEEIENLAPAWLTRGTVGSVLISAIAAVFAYAESIWDDWRPQVFRRRADEPYLTDLGEDRGIERFPWETDEEYRARATIGPESPTPARLKEALEALIPWEGYEVEVRELTMTPVLPQGTSHPDAGSYTDCGKGLVGAGDIPRIFLVTLPWPEVEQPDPGAWVLPRDTDATDQSSYVGWDTFTGATATSLRRRFLVRAERYLERIHPHGCAWGVVTRDSVEPVHIAHLFNQQKAIYL